MFPGESPGRSRLALLGRRSAIGGSSELADYGHATKINHFYNGCGLPSGRQRVVVPHAPLWAALASELVTVASTTLLAYEGEHMKHVVYGTGGERINRKMNYDRYRSSGR